MNQLAVGSPAGKFRGEMWELDDTGDTRIQWDPGDADQVAAAKKKFADLKARGYRAFAVKKSGSPGELLDEFDPMEERIIMSPHHVGG